MKLIVNNSSMVPIYEQLVDQIKTMIVRKELGPDAMLPSVRALSGELKISALTVKKAYDALEAAGLVVTVHGKGTFVAMANQNLIREEQCREVEALLAQAVQRAGAGGITREELEEMWRLVLEEN